MARPRVSNLVARVVRQQARRRRYEVMLGEEEVAVPSNISRSALMSEIHQAGKERKNRTGRESGEMAQLPASAWTELSSQCSVQCSVLTLQTGRVRQGTQGNAYISSYHNKPPH